MAEDPDGSALLTSPEVGSLLASAVEHAGGTLVRWTLDHVDANPPHSTTATYSAVVDWPYGRREELLGVSARASGPVATDTAAEIFADGEREVAVWLYPQDPDLPGLARAAYAESMAEVCNSNGVFAAPVTPSQLDLKMIGYRPRRRAVVKVTDTADGEVVYVKVLRERLFTEVVHRHDLLRAAGLPIPAVAATTPDHLLLLRELPGTPLAQAVFGPEDPCRAEDLIALLDSMPASVAQLERRSPGSSPRSRTGWAGSPPAASPPTATSTRASCTLPTAGSAACWTSTRSARGTGWTTSPASSRTSRRSSG
jgi:hypothetical protein